MTFHRARAGDTKEPIHLVCTCLINGDDSPIHERLIARCGADVTDQDKGWVPNGSACRECCEQMLAASCANCRGE